MAHILTTDPDKIQDAIKDQSSSNEWLDLAFPDDRTKDKFVAALSKKGLKKNVDFTVDSPEQMKVKAKSITRVGLAIALANALADHDSGLAADMGSASTKPSFWRGVGESSTPKLSEVFGLDEGDVVSGPWKKAQDALDTPTQTKFAPQKKPFDTFAKDVEHILRSFPLSKELLQGEPLEGLCADVDWVAGEVFKHIETSAPEKDAGAEKKFHAVIDKMEEFFKAFEEFAKELPEG